MRGVKYTKELQVTRPCKVAETHVGQIQGDCGLVYLDVKKNY